jgi:hypothetical protein
MAVKSVKYNWRQVGSLHDRDGAGEDYDTFTVGEKGVLAIGEEWTRDRVSPFTYTVLLENGEIVRIFNPNVVIYDAT